MTYSIRKESFLENSELSPLLSKHELFGPSLPAEAADAPIRAVTTTPAFNEDETHEDISQRLKNFNQASKAPVVQNVQAPRFHNC